MSKNISKNELKQAAVSLEAIAVERRNGPVIRGLAYDHAVRLRGLLDTETQKQLQSFEKKRQFVRESVEDDVKQDEEAGMVINNRDRFVQHRFDNHPEKIKLDKQVRQLWEGPVVNKVPTVNLPGLVKHSGTIAVNTAEGEWVLDQEVLYDFLVEDTGIVTLKEAEVKPLKSQSKRAKNG